MSGGAGDDAIEVGAGNDQLAGDPGNDTLTGGAGDDTLNGGTGDDVLVGGAGSDTYVYNLGDGNDLITDLGGDPGEVDTLSFGPGISAADVALSHTHANDLEARLADGSVVTVRLMYGDGANHVERIRFADGTVIDQAALDALPEGLVTGTDGPDVLIGTGGHDTLDGRGGDDVLDGAEDTDTLIGGAGNDRYKLGVLTAHDTVIEGFGEASTVELQSGLSLDGVSVQRRGDDLTVTIRGTENALTFQGYFGNAQHVTVAQADGTSASAEDLIAVTQGQQGSREALKEDFRLGIRAGSLAAVLSDGYRLIDDHTLLKREFHFASAGFFQSSFTTTITQFNDAEITSKATLHDDRSGFTYHGAHTTTTIVNFDPGVFASDDSFIFVDPAPSVERTQSDRWVEFKWTSIQASTTDFQSHNEFVVHDPNHILDDPNHFLVIDTVGTSLSGSALGLVSDLPDGFAPSPAPLPDAFFPRYGLVTDDITVYTDGPWEVLGGRSDNIIRGALIADGGAGNDFIVGGRLALGGDGDDRIEDAANQYGEAGNDRLANGDLLDGGAGDDVLRNGKVMQPGSGNDLMVGGNFVNVFRIGAFDSGVKLIWDSGDDRFVGGDEEDPQVVRDNDIVELPSAALASSLSASWSTLDSSSELGRTLGERSTLDVSWGTDTVVRLVVQGADDSDGNGVEQIRLGDGTVLGLEELINLVPPHPMGGTDGDDVLVGTSFADLMFGLGGDDSLYAGRGDDSLDGGVGDDYLDGGDGNDVLDGGAGDDSLNGGAGDDLYLFADGFGHDTLFDGDGSSRIRFTGSVVASDVTVTRGAHDLTLHAGADSVRISGWFDSSDRRIGAIEFADATVWDADTVEAQLSNIPTAGDDYLQGTEGADSIDGLAGDDILSGLGGDDFLRGGAGHDELRGNEGNDVLEGGEGDDLLLAAEGNDLLEGGAGSDDIEDEGHAFVIGGPGDDLIYSIGAADVVAFNPGDGNDTLYVGGPLTLSLGGGLTPAALKLGTDGYDLFLTAGPSDSIRLAGGFGTDPQSWPAITLQMFGSMHTYDFNAVIADFAAALAADPSLTEFTLGGVLPAHETSVSQTDALGGALAWKYATTGSTAGLSTAQIQALLADPDFGLAPQPISLGPVNNHAPVLAHAVGNRTTTEYLPFSLSVANALSDADPGDSLAYSAVLSSGAPLPAWLAFDETTQTFSGMPEAANLGTYRIRVTATDTGGLSASNTFRLVVAATPDQTLIGTDGDDVLVSHSGNDRLDGGLGADTMTAGRGNDVYVVDNPADQVIENPSEGTDTVESSSSFGLSANVENLTLTGDADIDGTGNSSRNTIVGNGEAAPIR